MKLTKKDVRIWFDGMSIIVFCLLFVWVLSICHLTSQFLLLCFGFLVFIGLPCTIGRMWRGLE